MKLAEKKLLTEEFSKRLQGTESLILASYQGLDVIRITELRRRLRESGFLMVVIKNRLVKRAMEQIGKKEYEDLVEFLKGPTAVIMGGSDPSQAIKVFNEYADEVDLMEFKAAIIKDNFYPSEKIVKIAGLPSREVLIAQTVNVFNAPLQGLCNVLSGLMRNLVYALNDLKNKREQEPSGSETPAEPEAAEDKKAETPAEKKETAEPSAEAKKAESGEESVTEEAPSAEADNKDDTGGDEADQEKAEPESGDEEEKEDETETKEEAGEDPDSENTDEIEQEDSEDGDQKE